MYAMRLLMLSKGQSALHSLTLLAKAEVGQLGRRSPATDPDAPKKPRRRPYMLDTCHTWASDSEITKRWVPDFYTGPDAEAVRAANAGKDVEM